jgi:rod shape determining protein RodA
MFNADATLVVRRFRSINWWIVLAIMAVGSLSVAVLYSAAGGHAEPWALKQGIRFMILLIMMLFIAMVRMETLLAMAYPAYGLVLILLVAVEIFGFVGGGAQRWIDLGVIQLQPSEFMKLTLVLALARYYHDLPRVSVTSWHALWPPALLILLPVALVLLQPNLSTATLILLGGIGIMFLAGVSGWLFGGGIAALLVSLPIVWQFMHDYQRRRVLTFIDPERDPLGAGYHITQSKIAIGSGGFFGKGYLEGTQGHLRFLPERHTDFIFPMLTEELGMVGAIVLFSLYAIILGWGIWVALTSLSHFARLLAMGLTITVFLYIAINLSMVMGLAPVVGIPLPLMSYGGSSMMTVLMALGLLFAVSLSRDERVGARE